LEHVPRTKECNGLPYRGAEEGKTERNTSAFWDVCYEKENGGVNVRIDGVRLCGVREEKKTDTGGALKKLWLKIKNTRKGVKKQSTIVKLKRKGK